MSHRRVVRFVMAALATVGALVACSSDDEAAGGGASSEASFCDALSSAYSKCNGAGSCSTPLAADCTKLVGLLSASALDAATTCLKTASCDSDPLSCIGKSLGEATQSDAQKKLAEDYCASCSVVGGEACTTAFFGTAQTPGLAIALLPFGDGAIDAIDSACTSNPLGKTACQSAFTSCLTATTTKFVATSVSADTATCLIEGIKAGISGGGPTEGPSSDGDAGGGPESPKCGPDNCSGCCDEDGKCTMAATERVCGLGGIACSACADGKVCEGGSCIDPGCKATCASGCCTAQGCQPGNTNAACGKGGDACTACGASQACTNNACTVSDTTTFDFVAVGASLPATKLDGSSWDAFSGAPDPIFKATSGSAAGETAYASNTLKPVWNTVVLSNLSAAALKGNLGIQIVDADTAFNDTVGGCPVSLAASDFDGNVHTKSCPKSATSVAFTFDYRLKAH